MDLKQIALNLIARNPNVANNPQAQNYINVLQNGTDEEGQQLAMNLCKTYNTTPQEAAQQAAKFFGLN